MGKIFCNEMAVRGKGDCRARVFERFLPKLPETKELG
jgi:hypothetical protein